jgi:4-amino-4-deoxy-L-arabinose transferase-like glycosyltransferase
MGREPELQVMETSSATGPDVASGWPLVVLAIILVLGASLRLVQFGAFQDLPLLIWDERDYDELAVNLAQSGEFKYTPKDPSTFERSDRALPTSLRPPLYPALVAASYSLVGKKHYHQAIRAFQIVLSLLTALLVYGLASGAYSPRVGLAAAALCCFYPSLVGFTNLILTEVFFTFLLCASCLAVVCYLQRDRAGYLALAGVLLGLSALTRSVMWLFPPLLAAFIVLFGQARLRRRLFAAALMVAVFAATIAPWAMRCSRLEKTFVAIDTMGGRNLMMGNYEHTPLYRSWDAVALQGDESWWAVLHRANPEIKDMSQGQLDKAAMRYGLEFVLHNPGLTLKRDLVKFIQFWGIERELLGLVGKPDYLNRPGWVVPVSLIVVGVYALAMFAGVIGMVMAPPGDWRIHAFLLLVLAFVCGMHSLVFAHSRYHLPLMPLVFIYSASALVHARTIWQRRLRWSFRLAVGLCLLLAIGWAWEILVVDGDTYWNLVKRLK